MSKNTVSITATEPHELTTHDLQDRIRWSNVWLHGATAVAIVLALLGVQPVICAMLPWAAVGIPTGPWAWRDLRALKRRRALREAGKDGVR